MKIDFSKYIKVTENRRLNTNVLWICFMFFLWGIASSMVFTLLPIFIVENLEGGGYKAFGFIEGSVVFLSFISRLFIGILIDISKKKLQFLKIGAFFTIISKALLTVAWNIGFIFIAKSIDRFIKGFRTVSTDSIFSELSPKNRGFAYSLKHMMNISGSLAGSLITSCLIILCKSNFRIIFILAIIPTIIAYIILQKKINYISEKTEVNKNWNIKKVKSLSNKYWNFIYLIIILMFARFSEGFITLRARDVMPNSIANLPIFMSLYEICIVLVAVPIGKLSDLYDKKIILLYGISLLLVANIISIFAYNDITIILMYLTAGIHMGATHGVLASIVSQSVPQDIVGTAFAIYYTAEGICLFLSNYIAGIIGSYSSMYPFIQGIIASFLACLYIIILIKKGKNLC